MMIMQTITTIELSSKCNLACRYCINRYMKSRAFRTPGIMSDEIFDHSLSWLRVLVARNTQREINLNGNGESCLDPDLPERIRRTKNIVGNRKVGLCTNGVNMTEELCRAMLNAGIDRIDISPHSPYHARMCANIFTRMGVPSGINMGSIIMTHNWAGQLDPEDSVPMLFTLKCDPLIEGRAYIDSDGYVTVCCYDYQNIGSYGHVQDYDLDHREIKPFSLCKTCHQEVPA